jgi:hypothetical protein
LKKVTVFLNDTSFFTKRNICNETKQFTLETFIICFEDGRDPLLPLGPHQGAEGTACQNKTSG